ncbi:signal transduction histidine kinase LytS [Pleurocapsales cyanobacterium LEGE 06147]|nr:signal transduction histidine kinase LytS [Pleurocapsales cyanobacterium LEGE 06147]
MAIQNQPRLRAIGTFPSRREAEEALKELRDSGFVMDNVSVLAKDTDRKDLENMAGGSTTTERGDTEAQEGAGAGAVTGTVLGGLGGLLVGLEALIIPGVGPFLAAGTIATTLAGAGIGAAAGGIVGALTGLAIPEEEAKFYAERVSEGDFLVIVEGTEDEINRAGSILSNRGISRWNVYDVESGRRFNSDFTTGERVAYTDRTVDTTINRDPTLSSDRTIDTTINRDPASDRIDADEDIVEIRDRRDDVR